DLLPDGPFAGLERGRYAVAVIDPPWHFHGGGTRTPQNHYQTMPIREIRALPVRDLLAPNCAVFLWTYWPLLDKAIDIGKRSWGLTYCSSAFVWVKIKKGASDALWLDRDRLMST